MLVLGRTCIHAVPVFCRFPPGTPADALLYHSVMTSYTPGAPAGVEISLLWDVDQAASTGCAAVISLQVHYACYYYLPKLTNRAVAQTTPTNHRSSKF